MLISYKNLAATTGAYLEEEDASPARKMKSVVEKAICPENAS